MHFLRGLLYVGLSSVLLLMRLTSLTALKGARPILHGSTRYSLAVFSSMNTGEVTKPGARASAAVVQDQNRQTGKKAEVEITLAPPKGTRDFYPDDHRLKSWLFGIWRDTARRYGFEEYDAPVVEHVELYIRKAGEEVTQQLYDFTDKGGRRLSLRPEMTPSLARMVLAKKTSLLFPLKWFSIPQCWRYERMTRGRRREHYQWNMDLFGVTGIEAEAELLSAIVFAFQQMKLSAQHVGLKINSRKLLNDLMARVNIPPEKWVATCVLVDKLDKVELSDLSKEVDELGVDMQTMEQLVNLLKLKTLDDYAAHLGADSEGVKELRNLFSLLQSYNIQDWFVFDPTVVRGLAYYTGIVFEGFDRAGELRAICGGGRYDKLLDSFSSATSGNNNVPAVGFGFGDAVIVELLKTHSLLPDVSRGRVDCVLYAMDETLRFKLLAQAQLLRQAGLSVDVVLEQGRKAKWVFNRADKINAQRVVVFASDEDVEGQVTVKEMKTGTQIRCNYENLVDHLLQYSTSN